jgi:hypothetical protein
MVAQGVPASFEDMSDLLPEGFPVKRIHPSARALKSAIPSRERLAVAHRGLQLVVT